MKRKINAFQIEQERKRREEEANARAEAGRLRKQQEEEAEKARLKAIKEGATPDEVKDIAPIVEPVMPESKPKVTRTESGSASLRTVWTWEPISFSEVPDDFKALDTKKINTAVKDGNRNIPGLRIFEKQTTVLR